MFLDVQPPLILWQLNWINRYSNGGGVMDCVCLFRPTRYNKSGATAAALAVAGGQVLHGPDYGEDIGWGPVRPLTVGRARPLVVSLGTDPETRVQQLFPDCLEATAEATAEATVGSSMSIFNSPFQ